MSRDERIGPTAHYTAYAWHRLGLPYAEHFATPRGRRLYWLFRGAGEWVAAASGRSPLLVDVLAYRHRTIDAEIARARPDVVVEIGAGLSPRGVWSVCDAGVERYVEVDLPHMVEAKRARLATLPDEARRRCEARLALEARDVLSDGFGAWLAGRLAGARRALVNAEGVLGYFDVGERETIVRGVARGLRAAHEGTFLCDLRDRERAVQSGFAVSVLRGAVQVVTRGRGLREDFADAGAVASFFAGCGLHASPVETPGERPMPTRIWRAAPA